MYTTISVCIATYNGERFLEQQLKSIIPQLSDNDEIIISDDGSKDSTLEIINSLNDTRIKVFTNNGEHGYTCNFENALNQAKNDIIILADQDDIWKKTKVNELLNHLKYADFIVHDADLIDENNIIFSNSFYNLRGIKKSILGNIVKFGFLGCCIAFRRKILDKALPFPKNHKLATHDNWLFLVGVVFYKYKILDEKLISYRRHSNNISTGHNKGTTSLIFKIKYRLYLIFNLVKRIFK